jgi:hypothetical protein
MASEDKAGSDKALGDDGFRFACKFTELIKGGTKCTVIEGRAIILWLRPAAGSSDFNIHALG